MDVPCDDQFAQVPQLRLLRRRLRLAMVKAGYETPSELADASGITEKAILGYLRGTRCPTAAKLVQLSRALGVTTDYLLGF